MKKETRNKETRKQEVVPERDHSQSAVNYFQLAISFPLSPFLLPFPISPISLSESHDHLTSAIRANSPRSGVRPFARRSDAAYSVDTTFTFADNALCKRYKLTAFFFYCLTLC